MIPVFVEFVVFSSQWSFFSFIFTPLLQLLKESVGRPEINLDGVFHPDKVQVSERSEEGIRMDVFPSTGMNRCSWSHTNSEEDVKARTKLVSIDILQVVNKSDEVMPAAIVKSKEMKELVAVSFVDTYDWCKIIFLTFCLLKI